MIGAKFKKNGSRDSDVICSMTQYKVKVTIPSKLEIWPFSTAISSTSYNGSWQLTTDSETRAQYLNLIGSDF